MHMTMTKPTVSCSLRLACQFINYIFSRNLTGNKSKNSTIFPPIFRRGGLFDMEQQVLLMLPQLQLKVSWNLLL